MKKSILISIFTAFMLITPVFAAEKTVSETKRSAPDMALYADWAKVRSKKIDRTFGKVRIRVIPGQGNFNVGVVNESGKTVCVLSNMNEYSSTYFSLKAGKKIYKLTGNSDVKTKSRVFDDRVQIIYSVNKVADVLVELIPVESSLGEGYDMVRIQTIVTNTSNQSSEISLKNVMDTVLGEADLYHFYTADELPIKNEVVFRTMANAQFFNSKNSAAWCQFMLYGADVTPIELVALTNYATADSSSWEPVSASNKTFDTVSSYNNSAVEIIWPAKKLLRSQYTANMYYIAVASDGQRPKGPEYIASRTEQLKTINSISNISEKTEKVIKTQKADKVKVETVEEVADEPDSSEFIPKELLTPEYVQSLLDRIESLEASDPALNKAELKMLNDELDFILSIMRS